MSLSEVLESKDGRAIFRKYVQRPAVRPSAPIRVVPRAEPRAWTGQAFDYALRFGLAARWPMAVVRRETLADEAVERLTRIRGPGDRFVRKAVARWEAGRAVSFDAASTSLSREQAEACFHLASLEMIGRGGSLARFGPELDRPIGEDHVAELRALYELVTWEPFRPKRLLALNPTFRRGSTWVGGADADLVVDDMVVEIKVVKEAKLEARHVRQVVGYAILASWFGIDGVGRARVTRCGIWFARSGELVSWNLEECLRRGARSALIEHFGLYGDAYPRRTWDPKAMRLGEPTEGAG